MEMKYGVLSADGHFFIPGPKQARKEMKERAGVRLKIRTEFLVLTHMIRPALVTIGVLLLVGAAALLKF
jgi:hypothetical protein